MGNKWTKEDPSALSQEGFSQATREINSWRYSDFSLCAHSVFLAMPVAQEIIWGNIKISQFSHPKKGFAYYFGGTERPCGVE